MAGATGDDGADAALAATLVGRAALDGVATALTATGAAAGTVIAAWQEGHGIWRPPYWLSQAMCCEQSGQENLVSLIMVPFGLSLFISRRRKSQTRRR